MLALSKITLMLVLADGPRTGSPAFPSLKIRIAVTSARAGQPAVPASANRHGKLPEPGASYQGVRAKPGRPGSYPPSIVPSMASSVAGSTDEM